MQNLIYKNTVDLLLNLKKIRKYLFKTFLSFFSRNLVLMKGLLVISIHYENIRIICELTEYKLGLMQFINSGQAYRSGTINYS